VILTKTPLRISLFGGGTDFPDFYRRNGGGVLSFAINRYVFVTLSEKFDSGFRVSYSLNESVSEINEIKHPLVRNSLMLTGVTSSLEITSIAEIPSKGSGLGSSSAFTVGLLKALYEFNEAPKSNEQIAADACQVEIDLSGEPIGKQDQYGCALGGIKYIEFKSDNSVSFDNLDIQNSEEFLNHCLLFYTGITRSASLLLHEQKRNTIENEMVINNLKLAFEHSIEGRKLLTQGSFEKLGKLLHEAWEIKKTFNSKVSNKAIDDGYRIALNSGAWGGKLLGAGGGGFILFMAPKSSHSRIKESLRNWRNIPFSIDFLGSRTIKMEGL
jgi:D-glycero-alpha-D-manno-heptose-7-phosphate kinase